MIIVSSIAVGGLVSWYVQYLKKRKLLDELKLQEADIQTLQAINAKYQEELAAQKGAFESLNVKLTEEMIRRETHEKTSFARDRYLATMSNEMRSPLNVITGITHLLLENNPRPDQVESLKTLQFSANDLVVFINDVLDYSNIEAGKVRLDDREFQPVSALQEVSRRFQTAARDKDILYQFSLDERIPERLIGDSVKLQQVLHNLLQFALQQTENGHLVVEVSLFGSDEFEAFLFLKISASGMHICQELNFDDDLESPGEKGDVEGYAPEMLSFSIAKRLIELQNGRLTITYEGEDETIYSALLPFKIGQAASSRGNKNQGGKPAGLHGKRVLIVEDNKINQLVVAKMLRKAGAEVMTANNGLEALEQFEQQVFDLVLMDIQMPEMDGYRATAELRQHPDPVKRETPVIALTSSAFLTEKEKANLFGMNDHVGKPFSPDELLEKIDACVNSLSKNRQ
jgi:CheY-like chemotaxis protein